MENYLAHSEEGFIPAQSYSDHVLSVLEKAKYNATQATLHDEKLCKFLVDCVCPAALFHDLGKLHPDNQECLNGTKKAKKLPIYHNVHGSVYLKTKKMINSSILINSHHIPIPCFEEYDKKNTIELTKNNNKNISELEDECNKIAELHKSIVDTKFDVIQQHPEQFPMFYRMALSCLVDADHSDTSENYGNTKVESFVKLKAKERLHLLDSYVSSLSANKNYRTKNRESFYNSCRNTSKIDSLALCDGPVGIGKTTAIVSHGLNIASKDDLIRRIFVVAPYCSLIDQTVKAYNKCLVLPGEKKEEVIGAHYHQVEFESHFMRQYTTNWYPPFVVLTAVQFFETLASNRPGKLRKLHNLARSVIYIDEYDSAIPTELWPLATKWLEQLRKYWGCYVILGSGSSCKFWEIDEFKTKAKVQNIYSDKLLRKNIEDQEKKRIKYINIPKPFSINGLTDFVCDFKGSKIVIFNTTQNAAVVARELKNTGKDVEHLSTVLSPASRSKTIKRILEKLKDGTDFILAATSCVECGMDFDFDWGFRELCSLRSLSQTGGRVHRNRIGGTVYSFTIKGKLISYNPAFSESRYVLRYKFDKNYNKIDFISSEDITESVKLEITKNQTKLNKMRSIDASESKMNFPEVNENFNVIDTDTILCIIDKEIAQKMKNGEKTDRRLIMHNSVQLWKNKQAKLELPLIGEEEDRLYEWNLKYDDFLGCMAGILLKLDVGAEILVN
jgi:CRISPR-associated endonuclease/helicase Cas3